MSVIGKLFNRETEAPEEAEPEIRCPHASLVPHWDNPDQLGKPEYAEFRCEACGEIFDYDAAQRLLHNTLPPEEE